LIVISRIPDVEKYWGSRRGDSGIKGEIIRGVPRPIRVEEEVKVYL
jgi:hypothetical protein